MICKILLKKKVGIGGCCNRGLFCFMAFLCIIYLLDILEISLRNSLGDNQFVIALVYNIKGIMIYLFILVPFIVFCLSFGLWIEIGVEGNTIYYNTFWRNRILLQKIFDSVIFHRLIIATSSTHMSSSFFDSPILLEKRQGINRIILSPNITQKYCIERKDMDEIVKQIHDYAVK